MSAIDIVVLAAGNVLRDCLGEESEPRESSGSHECSVQLDEAIFQTYTHHQCVHDVDVPSLEMSSSTHILDGTEGNLAVA